MSAFLSGFTTVFVPFFWATLGICLAIYIICVLAAIIFTIWDKVEDIRKPVAPHPGYLSHQPHNIDLSG